MVFYYLAANKALLNITCRLTFAVLKWLLGHLTRHVGSRRLSSECWALYYLPPITSHVTFLKLLYKIHYGPLKFS